MFAQVMSERCVWEVIRDGGLQWGGRGGVGWEEERVMVSEA